MTTQYIHRLTAEENELLKQCIEKVRLDLVTIVAQQMRDNRNSETKAKTLPAVTDLSDKLQHPEIKLK